MISVLEVPTGIKGAMGTHSAVELSGHVELVLTLYGSLRFDEIR